MTFDGLYYLHIKWWSFYVLKVVKYREFIVKYNIESTVSKYKWIQNDFHGHVCVKKFSFYNETEIKINNQNLSVLTIRKFIHDQ